MPLRPGVEAFLRQLDDAGVPRALVSSDRSEWLVTNLERLGWPDGWAAMVCADGDVSRAKPNPHLYEATLKLLGVPAPADVRDRGLAQRDPRSEEAAGIACLCVPNEATVGLDLSEADLVVPTLEGVSVDDAWSALRGRSPLKVLKIGFVGTRTDRPEVMADFFQRVLGLRPTHSGDDTWAFELPDGSIAEVFGPSLNDHFTTGPVAEFLVEDVVGRDRGAPRGGRPHRARARSSR